MKYLKSGTPNYLKVMNKKKLLQKLISDNQLYSRADLAKELNLSKPTISNLVDELVSEGWIVETESGQSGSQGGRRPVHLVFNEQAKYIIGIDIGGTSVEIAIMNLGGDVKSYVSLDTRKLLEKDITVVMVKEIQSLLRVSKVNPGDIFGLGVGAPGITDAEEGIIVEAPTLNWIQYPLRQELEKYFPFPIYVENDVNMAVLGEQWKGVAQNKDHVILVTLGTGVGCGIILNGELYRGSRFAAGEIGYMITNKDQAEERYDSMFAGYGFLENHVGGPALVNRMKKQIPEEDSSMTQWSAKTIFEKAIGGHPIAIEVVSEALDHIAVSLINISAILNPECIVLGGGISKSGTWFLPKLKEKIKRFLPEQSQTEIFITELPHVSLLGACALCLSNDELFSK